MPVPLWQRALDARRDVETQRAAERAAEYGRKGGYAKRASPVPRVGDVFGRAKVTAILGRGHNGRADLRVAVECIVCHRTGEAYEFNLRKLPRCVGPRGGRSHS